MALGNLPGMQHRRPPRGRIAVLNLGIGTANDAVGPHSSGIRTAMTLVWWIYPPFDEYQQATIHRPPRGGGAVRTLCKSTVDIEARANVSLNPHRPHCPECVGHYLSTPEPFPVWSY